MTEQPNYVFRRKYNTSVKNVKPGTPTTKSTGTKTNVKNNTYNLSSLTSNSNKTPEQRKNDSIELEYLLVQVSTSTLFKYMLRKFFWLRDQPIDNRLRSLIQLAKTKITVNNAELLRKSYSKLVTVL